jgi:hypothetical protein
VPRRDLSLVEQANVFSLLKMLRNKFGNWETVERALPISHSLRVELTGGRCEVSATLAFRVARLLNVSLHHVLTGTALPPGTCKHCGLTLSD